MNNKVIFLNSGIYSFLNLFQKGINFLLIPVLTVYLTTLDYGVVAVITAVNAFLSKIFLFSLTSSITRFYYEYEQDIVKIKKLIGTIVTFVLITSTGLTIILFLGHELFLTPFLKEIEFYPFMALGLLSVLFSPLFVIYQHTLQVKQEGAKYGKLNFLFFSTNLVLLLMGVIVLEQKVIGVIGALTITNIFFFFVTLYKIRKDIFFVLDKELIKECLGYSLPLIPHSISGIATNIIDRVFVNNLINTSFAGIYSIGNTFGGIVFLISSGVNQAFVPWFNKQVKLNQRQQIKYVAYILLVCYCLVALFLSWFGKEILHMITPPSFHEAWVVVPSIAFAFVFHTLYYFFSVMYFYNIEKRGSKVLPIYTISAAGLNGILNYYLISEYGIIGAAYATLITKILLSYSLSINYHKYLDVQYNKKFMFIVPFVFFGLSFLTYEIESIWIKIEIFIVILLISLLLVKKNYANLKQSLR